jgi:hypothetical protein
MNNNADDFNIPLNGLSETSAPIVPALMKTCNDFTRKIGGSL